MGPGATTFAYGHDAAAKITSVSINQPVFEWMPTMAYARTYGVANNMNQTTSEDGVPVTWNGAGDMTSDGVNTYVYTYGHRLVSATRTGMTATYAYDSDDRRTKKIVNGVMTRTLWSGADELGEYDVNGDLIRRFIPDGTGAMDARLATVEANGDLYWIHTDHQGSVIATSRPDGTTVGTASYSPHGEFGAATSAPPVGSPFGYTGRQYDPETGLYQYRARYYSPRLGVFLSADPIGTKDDPNLYLYVGNDPVNGTDPTGMEVYLSTRVVTPAVYGVNQSGRPFVLVPAQYHMFLVTHADYIGDPNGRIYSWGPTPGTQGSQLSGNPKELVQQFAGTPLNAADRSVWQSAESGELGRTVRIDAADDVAAAAAENVLGYPDYDAVPIRNGANSNSAAYAAARDADRMSGSRPASAPTSKPSVGTPGWDEQGRVQRRCSVTGSRIQREC